ncbi:CDP-glycerol glycerophosphotransferase family protein [Butyrivibrio sp. LC3010]|uniref:CDP-glycerol glycerophosphotransferase family protein n=1 Tax=Butyrivibrio sp. LC3010 TaxID=1280680 RepID=UPI001FA732D6|nr:CDP-glycerol glycerophosphotransferase family protein [Butyrivibrio sp. LC3010]
MLFRIMWLLPVKKNRVVFSSYEGDGGFCCNPRYIAEELHRRRPDLEIVWLLHDTTKEFPEYVKKVEDSTLNTVYYLATARIWIDNYRKPYGTLKRKDQLYIQTWHATIGFKAVGLYRGDAFPTIARMVSEWDSNLADYFLTNSQYCDDVYPKKLLYSGPTLRVGSPRIDPMINNKDELYKAIREKLGLDISCKLLLFAPTFRGGNQQGKKQVIAETPQIDFDRLIKTLTDKYNCEWKVLLRLHPQLSAKLDKMPLLSEDERLIDVSQMPDISEIMGGCDMVITDYSSCAFDAAFAGIPVLLFADDVQEYVKNRGQFMWKREELPFDIAEDNDLLNKNAELFNENRYRENVESFMHKYCVVEEGHASERVVDVILDNYAEE